LTVLVVNAVISWPQMPPSGGLFSNAKKILNICISIQGETNVVVFYLRVTLFSVSAFCLLLYRA